MNEPSELAELLELAEPAQHNKPTVRVPLPAPSGNESHELGLPKRCGLCKFKFRQGEPITAVNHDGRCTREIAFDFHHRLWDKDIRTLYTPSDVTYLKDPRHVRAKAVGFHLGCAALHPDKSSKEMFDAVFQDEHFEYEFDPPVEEDRRRARWLRGDLAKTLHVTLLPQLPPEICTMVAKHCYREFAAAQISEMYWQEKPSHPLPAISWVGINKNVYIDHTEVQGVKYVSGFSDGPTGNPSASRLVVLPQSAVDTLHVASDHLGIRDLVFASSKKPPVLEEQANAWWRSIPLRGVTHLTVKSDGSKLRKISSVAETETLCRVLTSQPLAMANVRYSIFSNFSPVKDLRLRPSHRSGARPIGYSCGWQHNMITMHVHVEGEDLSFYTDEERHMRTQWTYVPMDKDEFLTELWSREEQYRSRTIVIRTNKDRVALLGQAPREDGSYREKYTLLDQNEEGITSPFWIDDHYVDFYSGPKLRTMAFTSPEPTKSIVPPILRAGENLQFAPELWTDNFFWTWADLSNIARIAICRASDGTKSINGLLLRYGDEHITSVGEIRLDKMEAWVSFNAVEDVWLTFSSQPPRLEQINLCMPQISTPGKMVMKIPMHGKLEWWHSRGQCRICHDGQVINPLRHLPQEDLWSCSRREAKQLLHKYDKLDWTSLGTTTS